MTTNQTNRINKLSIKNFKSVRELEIAPERINVFVGRPNVGKSNILEALALFSGPFSRDDGQYLSEMVRYEDPSQLFYDRNRQSDVDVTTNLGKALLQFITGLKKYNLFIGGREELSKFFSTYKIDSEPKSIHDIETAFTEFFGNYLDDGTENLVNPFLMTLDITGSKKSNATPTKYNTPFKRYEYPSTKDFSNSFPLYLLPPYGENLVTILEQEPELFELIQPFFEEFGLELLMDNYNYRLELQKKIGHKVYKIPYTLMADTLQRIIFYLTAIRSNRNSILLFEEPEAHAFPAYVQLLADEMGRDTHNQYFITTHNPYFVETLLEEEYRNEVGIFLTYYEDYQTEVKKLGKGEIDNLIGNDADLFSNLNAYKT